MPDKNPGGGAMGALGIDWAISGAHGDRAASSTGFPNSQARETSEKRERGVMGTSVERDHPLVPAFLNN